MGVKVPLVILVWIDKTVSRGSTLRICQGLFKPLFIQKEFEKKKKKPRGELEIVLIWADFWIRREQLNFLFNGMVNFKSFKCQKWWEEEGPISYPFQTCYKHNKTLIKTF